ncbi:MAG: ribosome maturation factor RimM [Pseudomonadota bacterium]
MDKRDWITVGKLTTVFGIKGWIKVHSYTQPAQNLFKYPELRLTCPHTQAVQALKFDVYQAHGKGFIAHIDGCDDRDQAQRYTKKEIQVPNTYLPELDENDYYWHQLEGLSAWSTTGDANEEAILLGRVSHLLETGANDVLVVVPCQGSVDQQERLIPYVDQVVRNISLDDNTIKLDWGVDY